MCGIAGCWTPEGIDSAVASAAALSMASAVRHRGPDDAGTWCDGAAGLALGHRRLSILDPSAEGHQPMVSRDGRWVLNYNGEIYNFPELRAPLEAAGIRFRGHSDTEILVEGIAHWGLVRTLQRAAGMFALAVWDRESRTLHLARDRFGEKPLYYGWMGRTFLFASELKSMRAHPAWRGEVDRDALALYLRYNCVPAPYSIYAGIRKLLPAHVAEVRASGEPTLAPYWSLEDAVAAGVSDPLQGSDEELVTLTEERLRRTIGEQMVADVPLGALLSGGIDSSTVVALMQVQSARPVRTFTIGFHEAGYNEAEQAKAVARHLGTDHTELYVTPRQTLDVIPRIPEMYDEPFGDSSQVPTFLVAQARAPTGHGSPLRRRRRRDVRGLQPLLPGRSHLATAVGRAARSASRECCGDPRPAAVRLAARLRRGPDRLAPAASCRSCRGSRPQAGRCVRGGERARPVPAVDLPLERTGSAGGGWPRAGIAAHGGRKAAWWRVVHRAHDVHRRSDVPAR
jgi:asparagine synthase (glutamine-hydrolysing)